MDLYMAVPSQYTDIVKSILAENPGCIIRPHPDGAVSDNHLIPVQFTQPSAQLSKGNMTEPGIANTVRSTSSVTSRIT